jgi:hypothetical protein
MKFREFLLNEDHVYLGQKVGDVLTALHELEEDSEGMGTRHLMSSAENIVNLIRRILHTNWAKTEMKYLPTLQKCGVAIMNAIDQKDDLRSILSGVRGEMEKLSGDLGVPQNSLASPTSATPTVDDSMSPPEGKAPDSSNKDNAQIPVGSS